MQQHWPQATIVGVDFFTARIRPRPGKGPQGQQRQQAYLRALEERGVTVHLGVFQLQQKPRPLVRDPSIYELVHDTEEKGSDVNLASRLLVDGFQGAYDAAIVISNDGDLKMPVDLVRTLLTRPLGVLNPHLHAGRSRALTPPGLVAPSFYAKIEPADFFAAQLPDPLSDKADRLIHKPAGW